jgi:hypothetical protein
MSRRDSDLSQLSQADELPDVHAQRRQQDAQAQSLGTRFAELHVNDAYDVSQHEDTSGGGEAGADDAARQRQAAKELGLVTGDEDSGELDDFGAANPDVFQIGSDEDDERGEGEGESGGAAATLPLLRQAGAAQPAGPPGASSVQADTATPGAPAPSSTAGDSGEYQDAAEGVPASPVMGTDGNP